MRAHTTHARRTGRALALALAGLALGLGSSPAHADTRTVTVTGRFTYRDDAGRTLGIRFAPVEMWNDNGITPAELMGTSQTDADGNYSVTGTGSDWLWDGPDPFVRVLADTDAARVRTRSGDTYCFRTATTSDPPNGATLALGAVSPANGLHCTTWWWDITGEHGAWNLHNAVRQEWELLSGSAVPALFPGTLATSGAMIPKVQVVWPNDCNGCGDDLIAYANPDFLGVGRAMPWNEAGVGALYGGYHLLHHFAQYGDQRWNMGVGGALSEFSTGFWGHGTFSATFGCRGDFTGMPGRCGTLEAPPHDHPDGGQDRLAWITSAILWDMQDDTPGENHDGDNSIDRLAGRLVEAWDVIALFDPDPAEPTHDHPRTLQEFWSGVLARHPDLANRLSAIYHENHAPAMPAANLRVSALLGAPPASVPPGASFTLDDTTANTGAIRTGEPSTTTFYLSADATITPQDLPIGQRSVPNLAAGSASAATTLVSVPLATPAGSYFIGACADGPGVVFESDESDNCVVLPGLTILIQKSSVLSVTKAGTGSGHVTSAPAGIDCGADCAELYPAETVVTLSATPAAGSSFAGWSGGGCSGTGTCTLTVGEAVTVNATFNLPPPTLSVSPTLVRPGANVTVTWSGIGNATPRDWIGVYVTTAPDSLMEDFVYVTPPGSTGLLACRTTPGSAGLPSGSCRYRVPADMVPGSYELRLFPNDAFSPRLAVSNTLVVR